MKFLLVALALFATPAAATEWSTPLTDLRGQAFVDEMVPACQREVKPDTCAPLTLGVAAANALSMNDPDEKDLAPREKARRGRLAERVYNGGNFDLGADDVALIKRLMNKLYGNVVMMRALPLLDPNDK